MEIFSLKDRVVVVTGACGLLGREHVEAIALAGGIPIILDLNQQVIVDHVRQVNQKYNINASGYCVDITNEDEVSASCEAIVKQYGRIDGLVNNAANNPKVESSDNVNFSRLENFKVDVWNADLNVSLTGSFLCIKHYGTQIARNPDGGSIVNISSDLGLIAPDQGLYHIAGLPEDKQPVKPVTYSVAKTGLIGLTRYVATYWATKNVRCNAMCPGGVENNQNEQFLKEVKKRIPMNRMALKNEYQGLLIFLLSGASSYVNGSIIAADGGRSAW
jgi:NAD(P)-dependent dehydrogenase (short-subunit alcohol dehydrogenase family)